MNIRIQFEVGSRLRRAVRARSSYAWPATSIKSASSQPRKTWAVNPRPLMAILGADKHHWREQGELLHATERDYD